MKINLKDVQYMLSTHNYLEFDKLLTSIYKAQSENINIYILKNGEVVTTISTFEEIEEWKKRMVQIYGLYGFI